jgi:hypothetical protein
MTRAVHRPVRVRVTGDHRRVGKIPARWASVANFPRTATSVPSEWIPPKDVGDQPSTAHQDWIVPGVHVLWDDSSQMRLRRRTKMLWASAPRTVLLVKKWEDARVTAKMREIASWLTAHGIRVLIEENVQAEMDYEPFCAKAALPWPDFAGKRG